MTTCQDFEILVNYVLQGVWSCSLFIAWCTAWAKLRQMTVMADMRGKAMNGMQDACCGVIITSCPLGVFRFSILGHFLSARILD
jgi:hypothetical protein